MADAVVTESSPVEAVDPFKGEQVSLAEYQRYRTADELPERFKPAETAAPAAADSPEQTADATEGDQPESDPESDPEGEPQEQPQKGSAAEKRIKQLLAKTKELERKLAEAPKPTQTDSSTARPQPPQNYKEYRDAFKPSEWVAEYAKAHPQASYEDANAAMADHLADARDHFRNIEQRVTAEKQALDAKVEEARERYENFDDIKTSFLSKVISDKGAPLIPLPVLGIINDSEMMADLLYTIGSDEQELEKFVAMAKKNPNQAIRYVAKVENLIAEELAKPKGEAAPKRNENGQFVAPVTKKTQASAPPKPVGGTSSRAFDVSDESLSPEEWMRKRTQDIERRRG